MKSLFFAAILCVFFGVSLKAQVYPGEYMLDTTHLKFRSDSIQVLLELKTKDVLIIRGGKTRFIRADSVSQHGDSFIIQTPFSQFLIDCWEISVLPPFYTNTFEEQINGCARSPVKYRLSSGDISYVYLDHTNETFRVEKCDRGYRRIWIDKESKEFDRIDKITR